LIARCGIRIRKPDKQEKDLACLATASKKNLPVSCLSGYFVMLVYGHPG
jgi:hypothetical protein